MTQPYSDFFTTFQTRITLPEEAKAEWTMRGNFSTPLASGLSNGYFLSINAYVKRYQRFHYLQLYGRFRKGKQYPEDIFNQEEVLTDLTYQIGLDDDQINRENLTERLGVNKYILITNVILSAYGDAIDWKNVFAFDSEIELREFLQGLLTMTRAFNISPSEVIAVKPFKGEQDYNIQGLGELPSIV